MNQNGPDPLVHRNIAVARALGYAGLVPFVVTVGVLIVRDDGPLTRFVMSALTGYGAIILSFMGAVHWGRALFASPVSSVTSTTDSAGDDQQARTALYVASVCPAILAWFALLTPVVPRLLLLIAGFGLLYVYDAQTLRSDQSLSWYLQLRLRLTLIVVTCLGVALVLFL